MRSSRPPRKSPSQILHDRKTRLEARAQAVRPRGLRDGVPAPFFRERRAMRSPEKSQAQKATKMVPAPPSAGVVAYSRLAFGPSPGDIEAFDALGATDAQRLQVWVDQQLDPSSLDDSAADARLAQSGFQTMNKTSGQLWNEHTLAEEWDVHMQPLWETRLATWIRAIHSRRQLFEVLVDFWHNHFNVFADEFLFGSVWSFTDTQVIRTHALGNFRQMIEDVTRSPAMLFYLDNVFNNLEDANENYARELIELHTMGAEAYLGSMPQGEVPTDGNGVPIGYTEDDVIGAARCLTGWTLETDWVYWEFENTGDFIYYDDWHDHAPKTVLGLDLPANQGPMQDGFDLLDRLAQHPATAQHVAGKLARRLLGDFPPQSVVDAAAAVFSAQWQAPDQIAQVVRTIVLAPEFLTTWGDKVKRPFEMAASCFRGGGADLAFELDDDDTGWFEWEYYQTGQPLFGWHPPNGYPDIKFAWNTTSPRVMCWRMANFFVQIYNETTETHYFDLLGQTPAGVRSAQELVDFWGARILGRPLLSDESQSLVNFMAQGASPSADLPLDDDWNTQERLRAMVALIFMSPSFLWR